MDKYEYKLRADEIKSLIQAKQYKEAVDIADTIDWRNVRNSVMLCTISDLYKVNKRYEDSREVLLLAYDRNPGSRMILYSLCELSIKLNDIVNALEFFKEYIQVASHDTGKYILQYKVFTAQGAGIDERIAVLEELQKKDCKEKWMYELANLYHIAGYGEKCVEECNQIIIYFGEGKYVIKALELMGKHKPLSMDYQHLYNRLTSPIENDIVVNTMDVSQYNPDDLQKELANNLKEVLTDVGSVTAENTVNEDVIVVVDEPASDNVQAENISEIQMPAEAEVKEEIPAYTEETSEPEVKVYEEAPVKEPEVEDLSATTIFKPINIPEPEVEEATKIIDTKAVNRALASSEDYKETVKGEPRSEAMHIAPPSEIDFKGQIVEPAGRKSSVWDMHEIDFGKKNSDAIKYPNYEDMVSVEGDGQITIVMPEQENVEKQITGQISIDDVLLEWERMKTESDKKWQEDVKKRVLSQTNDMFESFDETSRNGLLEELENSVSSEDKVILTAEEQRALLNSENPEDLNFSADDIEDENGVEEIILLEEEPEQPVEEIVQEAESDNEIEAEAVMEESNDSAVTEETIEEGPTPEELYFDRTPFLSDKKEKEEVSDDTAVMPKLENLDYFMQFAASIEEHETVDNVVFAAAEMIANDQKNIFGDNTDSDAEIKEIKIENNGPEEIVVEEVQEAEETIAEAEEVEPGTEIKEEDDTIVITESEESDLNEEELSDVAGDEITAEDETTVESEVSSEENDEEIIEEVIEETTSEETEVNEVTDDDNTDPETEEEESEESGDNESVSEESEDNEPDNAFDMFTDEQYERYEDFIQAEGVAEQLYEALGMISMEASHGNIIIGSDDVDSAVELGKAIITEVAEGGELSGKVAKIKASTLNVKDVRATLEALNTGALIVQDIGDLKEETIKTITDYISEPEARMLIVFTASQRVKHKFVMDNVDIKTYFDVSVDISSMEDRELVEYGRKYAEDQEFSIDEVGLLAFHRRIEECQTHTHAVRISEVRNIIDEAIEHASKKNVGHFFDIIVGKRYDDNDMIVLREKDFE